ncbi:hypothetical protein QTP70_027898, partial [Hemibagrus guttatus]
MERSSLRTLVEFSPDRTGVHLRGSSAEAHRRLTTSYIHSFIVYRLSELLSGHGEPVPISGVIGHQGRIHPGRSYKLHL